MKLPFVFTLLLCIGHGLALKQAEITRYQRRAQVDKETDEFGWIESNELMVSRWEVFSIEVDAEKETLTNLSVASRAIFTLSRESLE